MLTDCDCNDPVCKICQGQLDLSNEPITPKKARKSKIKVIPSFVIICINVMITKNYKNGYSKFRQDDLVSLIEETIPEGTKFDRSWLDFEPIYENVGWKVTYDKPGYNESYPATFEFEER